ncbi:MAG: nucleotide exchange factor GrpE [Candidatus Dormibacteria bacterium]
MPDMSERPRHSSSAGPTDGSEVDLPESQVDAQPDAHQEEDHVEHVPPPRTRAEEMGIPPLWAVGGEKGKSKELRKQLQAAEEAVEKARREATEATERHLRLAAEMENVRRRHQKDREEQQLYGNAELIARILPLLDNFHRALDHAPETTEADPLVQQWVSGVQMVVRQFEEILAGAGVETIEAVGQPFDPNQHQAVLAEPSDEYEDGHVVAELQRGYRLRDRVLRPTMVKVANNG